MPPPAAPVISVDDVSAMSIRLIYETAVTFPEAVRFERCTGAGCTSWAAVSPSNGAALGSEGYNVASQTYAQRVTAGQTYRYRAYVFDAIDGNSGFSNILEVTIPTGTTGLTQVAGAVGVFSGFPESTANAARQFIALRNGGGIEVLGLQGQATLEAASGCFPNDLHSRYGDAMGNLLNGPSALSAGPVTQHVPGFPENLDILHCNTNQSVEMRFRFGSTDYITKQHLSDGYYEVRVNGNVVIRVDGIAIGTDGYAGYEIIRVSPFGSMDDAGVRAGMTVFYSNSTDVYGAGYGGPDSRWNHYEVYANMTDADMWTDIDPENLWSRYNDLYAPSTSLPAIIDGIVTSGTSFMEMSNPDEEPPDDGGVDPPDPGNGVDCPTKRPCDPEFPEKEPDDPPPSEGGEFLCAGGGDVPFYPTAVQPSMAGVREPRTWVRIDFLRDVGVA